MFDFFKRKTEKADVREDLPRPKEAEPATPRVAAIKITDFMEMPEPGSPKSYLPFVGFVPPNLIGAKEILLEADDRRHAYLMGALRAASRWHDKLDDLYADKKINEAQRDALNAMVREIVEAFPKETGATVWLDRDSDRGEKDLHEAIRENLKAGVGHIASVYAGRMAEVASTSAPPTFSDQAWQIPAEAFHTPLKTRGVGVISSDFSNTNMCIIFGPYQKVGAGSYIAYFHLQIQAEGSTWGPEVKIDVTVNGDVVQQTTFGVSTLRDQGMNVAQLQFDHVKKDAPVEFRVWTTGRPLYTKLIFRGVTLDPA